MRFQFSTSTLMLATTIAAITCAAILFLMGLDSRGVEEIVMLRGFIAFASPFIVPAAFIGFAIGRRSLTARIVIVFALAEAAATATAYLVQKNS